MEDTGNSTSYYQIESLDVEPFAGYQTKSNEPGLGFYTFVLVYTFIAFLIIAPLVSWSRNQEEKKLKELDEQRQESIHRSSKDDTSKDDNKLPSKQEDDVIISNDGDQKTKNCDDRISNGGGGGQKRSSSSSSIGTKNDITAKDSKRISSRSRSRKSTALRSAVLRELDHSYPDRDPDFQNHILRSSAGGIPQQFHNTTRISQDQQRVLQQQVNGGDNSKQPIETSSSSVAPSAATTSKIHQNSNNPSNKGFSKRVLDVGGRRWKNRRPIGRVDVISNVIVNSSKNNPPSIIGSKKKVESSPGQKKASAVSSSNSNSIIKGGRSRPPQTQQLRQSYFGMSDVASSILSEQYHQLHSQPKIQIDISMMKKYQLEQLQQQQQFQMQQQQHFLAMHRLAALEKQQQQRRYSQRKTNRNGSRSIAASERSAMSSIVDDISPDDAPDAKDPGKGNVFIETDEKYWNTEPQYSNQEDGGGEFNTQVGCCSAPLEGLLALAVPDQNKKNILRASIPLALGASSEALFRLITIAFISRCLGTESMIGMLLIKSTK
jgi:hypothetical protein